MGIFVQQNAQADVFEIVLALVRRAASRAA
jgi:hypothetical protein